MRSSIGSIGFNTPAAGAGSGLQATLTYDADGKPTDLGNIGGGTAKVTDFQAGDGWVIGRFAGGSFGGKTFDAKTGVHFAIAPALTNLPTSGTAFYKVAAFTPATMPDGGDVGGTALSINLGINFGSGLRYGFDGSLAFNDTSVTFATMGDAANPILSSNVSNSSNGVSFYLLAPLLSASGSLCARAGLCQMGLGFRPSGNGVPTVTAVWGLVGPAERNVAEGAAILVRDASAGVPPVRTSGAPSGLGLSFAAVGPSVEQIVTTANVNAGPSGELAEAITIASGAMSKTFSRNTAASIEQGGAAGIIGWSRWASGSPTTPNGGPAISANQGIHSVWGAPLTNLPTAGSATYDMVGATKPTIGDGSVAPGSFSGKLGVSFAARTVGWQGTITMGANTYAFGSSGGADAPSVTFGSEGKWFSATTIGATSTRVSGFLAGDGASHAGMAYSYAINQSGAASSIITGTAAFQKR